MSRLALTLGLTAMDTCWLAPWMLLIALWSPATGGRPLLGAPTVFALLLLAALSAWFFGRRRLSAARRAWFAAIAFVTVTIAVRVDQFPHSGAVDWMVPLAGALAVTIGQLSAPVLAFGVGLFLWWRGIRLGSQAPTYVEVESGFRWGIGLLVAFGLIMALSTRSGTLPALEAQTTPFVIGFFFVSLITLGLGRLESLRTRTRKLSINTQWLSLLVLVAGLVVLVALVAAQLVSFDVLVVVTRPFFAVLEIVLTLVLYALVIPLAYVVQWLIYLVLSLVQFDPNRTTPQPLEPADVQNILQRFFAEHVPSEIIFGLKAAGAALLLGIGLLIVARAMSRWRPTNADADATNEERESLWRSAGLKARLLAWLRRLLGRGDRVAPSLDASVAPPVAATGPRLQTVRELYLQLLRLGVANGALRAPATTPLEHLPALSRVLEPDQAVTHLTDAYLRSRYADLEPPSDAVDDLRQQAAQVRPIAGSD